MMSQRPTGSWGLLTIDVRQGAECRQKGHALKVVGSRMTGKPFAAHLCAVVPLTLPREVGRGLFIPYREPIASQRNSSTRVQFGKPANSLGLLTGAQVWRYLQEHE